jgi:excisionase family DNA binding protein
MNFESADDYLSIEEAAAFLGVQPSYVRRLLRQFGLGELTRATMTRQVRIRRGDLEKLHVDRRQSPGRRGVA